MRVLFTSIRGQGHTRPLLPFAKGMLERGHEVRIASPEDTRPIADKAGLTLMPFDRMSDAEIQTHWAGLQNLSGEEAARVSIQEMFANRTARAALPKLQESMEAWRPDIVIRDSAEFAAFAISEQMEIPHARVGVHNCAIEAQILELVEGPIDDILVDLNMSRQAGSGLWSEPAFSMFPEGFDGGAKHGTDNPTMRVNVGSDAKHVETDWSPKTDLPLVYVSFGTVAGGDLFGFQEVYAMAVDAVSGLEVEALLTTGPNVDPKSLEPSPKNLEIRQFVPQAAVLKHASAVVHHCGSGTLLGAFEAGVPSVAIPLFADQPWNADRLETARLGVAVRERSVDNIRHALVKVLENNEMAKRAKIVAEEMANLPRIEAAFDRIEKLASVG